MEFLSGLLKLCFQAAGHFCDEFFVALVPAPVAFAFGVDESGFFEDSHVMGDGGLGELDALFDVSGTESGLFVEGASTFFFERVENAAARGVGDGVEEAVEAVGTGVGGRQGNFVNL